MFRYNLNLQYKFSGLELETALAGDTGDGGLLADLHMVGSPSLRPREFSNTLKPTARICTDRVCSYILDLYPQTLKPVVKHHGDPDVLADLYLVFSWLARGFGLGIPVELSIGHGLD